MIKKKALFILLLFAGTLKSMESEETSEQKIAISPKKSKSKKDGAPLQEISIQGAATQTPAFLHQSKLQFMLQQHKDSTLNAVVNGFEPILSKEMGVISPHEIKPVQVPENALLEFFKIKNNRQDIDQHAKWEIEILKKLKEENPEAYQKYAAGVISKTYNKMQQNNMPGTLNPQAPFPKVSASQNPAEMHQYSKDFLGWFSGQQTQFVDNLSKSYIARGRGLLASLIGNGSLGGVLVLGLILMKYYGCEMPV